MNYQMLQKADADRHNLMEVPSLTKFNTCFHPLFSKIRKHQSVKSFKAGNTSDGIYLIVVFKSWLTPVNELDNTFKKLFNGYRVQFGKLADGKLTIKVKQP